MFYSPHTLFKVVHETQRDEYGYIVNDTSQKRMICPCRCDDSNTEEIVLSNGERYKPRYYIVCQGGIDISEGDYVIAYKGESIRGEGKVVKTSSTNYYSYTELWL